MTNVIKKFKGLTSPVKKKDIGKEIGSTGTNSVSGYISEDYLHLFNGSTRQKVELYDEMGNDEVISACLSAQSNYIVSSKFTIEGEDESVNEWIEECLMKNPNQSWSEIVDEVMDFVKYGFYYFEEVYEMRDGKVCWNKFAPRQPSAHEKWAIENGDLGVTQSLPTSQTGTIAPEIPWNKLSVFTHKKRGSNYSGKSILRSCYGAWVFKRKARNLRIVNQEKFAVGYPYIKVTEAVSDADIDRLWEIVNNITSSEKSGAVIPAGCEIGFMNPTSDAIGNSVDKTITDANRGIIMAFLANFLGNNNGGSFAKSENESKMFLLNLDYIANIIADTFTMSIQRLCDMNNIPKEKHPRLNIEVAKLDAQEFIQNVSTLIDKGIVAPDEEQVNNKVRKVSGLPEATKSLPSQQKKEEPQEKKDPQKLLSRERKGFFLAKSSQREKVFVESINDQEKFLQNVYEKQYIPLIEKTEARISKYLTSQYKKAKTTTINGIEKITPTGNKALIKDMESGVNKIMNEFKDKLNANRYMNYIHDQSMRNALKLNSDLEKRQKFLKISVRNGSLNSFLNGYISNVNGFVFNEGRRVKERIADNLAQGVSVVEVNKQVGLIRFNRNTYNLSVLTHPRGLYRQLVYLQAEEDAVTLYKALTPDFITPDLSPSGQTASILFLIFTAKEWAEKIESQNNVNPFGLGLHHNSQVYFMPILAEEEEEQREVSREQRRELEELLNNQ